MPYAAIIAEYDPFHSGHAYHIKQTKSAGFDGIAVIMSGNFTQRGYPAILPREYRAEAALRNGADMVIELPLPWSSASAEVFAGGAVGIVNSLNIFNALSFGSFADSTEQLVSLAEITKTNEFSEKLGAALSGGVSYPRAAAEALKAETDDAGLCALFKDANSVLACEYIKALGKLACSVAPINIKRIGAEHGGNFPKDGFASATWLREQIYKQYNANMEQYGLYNLRNYFTPQAYSVIMKAAENGVFPVNREKFSVSSLSILRASTAEKIGESFEAAEGLENRIYKALRQSTDFSNAADCAKTKRFTHARIRRIMLSAYLGADASLYRQSVPYARVIGVNDKGCEMLSAAQKKASVPVLTRIPSGDKLPEGVRRVFEFNARAEDLYNLCLPQPRDCGTYFKSKLIRI